MNIRIRNIYSQISVQSSNKKLYNEIKLKKSRQDPKFLKAAFRGYHTLDYYDGIDMDNSYVTT